MKIRKTVLILLLPLLFCSKAWGSYYPNPGESFLVFLLLVLLATIFFTIFEVFLIELTGSWPGGFLSGAIVSTVAYTYLIKKPDNDQLEK